MAKEIVVKNPTIQKFLGWLERKSVPMRALAVTSILFGLTGFVIGLLVLIGSIFGVIGLSIFIFFVLVYITVLRGMIEL